MVMGNDRKDKSPRQDTTLAAASVLKKASRKSTKLQERQCPSSCGPDGPETTCTRGNECHQHMLAREERQRRKMEEYYLRPPPPPPIVHYSDHEGSLLGERIKEAGQFAEAARVLLTWLERGEVIRRNGNNFYSMTQSSKSHICRLMSEKAQHENEMEEAKDKFKTTWLLHWHNEIRNLQNVQLMGLQ